MVGPSELLHGQSDRYTNRLAFPARQSGATPGPPHDAPVVANTIGQSVLTIGQSGYTYIEPTVAHYAPIYHTPQQQYIPPPIYLNHIDHMIIG
jgi:hypothetical protein